MEFHSFKAFAPVEAKITVSLELYSLVVGRVKEMLEARFSKPNTYYDGEKKNVIGVANIVFSNIISKQDIEDITLEAFSVQVEDATKLMESEIKPGETSLSGVDTV